MGPQRSEGPVGTRNLFREEVNGRRPVAGKFVGADGCSEQARGEAVPVPGFTTNTRPLGLRTCSSKDTWLRHHCRDNRIADTFVDGTEVDAHRLLQLPYRIAVWLNRSEREARKAGGLVVICNRLWPPALPRMNCGRDSIKSGLLPAAKVPGAHHRGNLMQFARVTEEATAVMRRTGEVKNPGTGLIEFRIT